MVIAFSFLLYVVSRLSSGVRVPCAPLGRVQVLTVVVLQTLSTRLQMSDLQI